MRIALVSETWSPDINGVAHTLKQIGNELHHRGHALHLKISVKSDSLLGTAFAWASLQLAG